MSLYDAGPSPAAEPFADLPQAMVREMLGSSRRLAGGLADDISSMRSMRSSVRESLAPLLGRDSDLPRPESPPSTAGVDGSHCAERMLATDIVAMGAVAVEGLGARRPGGASGPPARLWPRPRHFVHVESLVHDDANPVSARAVMSAMEVQLASLAPHDVVFVDGSLATPAISLDIALRQRGGGPPSLARYLEEGEAGGAKDGEDEDDEGRVRFGPIERTLSGYLRMLAPGTGKDGAPSGPPGQTIAAVAKYSQRSEICERLGLPNLDDRGLLSLVLEPGEYVGPLAPGRPAPGRAAYGASGGRLLSGRIPGGPRARSLAEAIADAVNAVRVLYYRPHSYSPAIRLELGGIGAGDAGHDDRDRTGALLEAVRLQSAGPGLMEPYPVYMADRMAKSLPRALPAMRGIAVSAMSRTWGPGQPAAGDGMGVAELYIAARGYRT